MLKLMQKLGREWQMFWWKKDRIRMKRELRLSLPGDRVWKSGRRMTGWGS